ncbi:MAG: AAA family ATPase [Thermoanaerobaculia bacterium]|nr:AAA family ATPase [Thermoanaerobaculia bacterium]
MMIPTVQGRTGWVCEHCALRVYVSREDHERNHKSKPMDAATARRGLARLRREERKPARGKPGRRKRVTAEPVSGKTIEINERFQLALDAIASKRPIVLITGGAGTGKSTFIRALRERAKERNLVVLAPTGVAALNAGGQTIHSFCRLPLKPIVVPDDIATLADVSLVEKLDLLVVDEISMVRADVLDGLECFLRLNRKSSKPFGGVQIVLVGDPLQLPPVVRADDAQWFRERYGTPHFFRAACLKGLRSYPVELTKVYRQKDQHFADLLAKIRTADAAPMAVDEINRACVGRVLSGAHLVLAPTRAAAARENEKRLGELPGKIAAFQAKTGGTFMKKSDDQLPAPIDLVLKKNAQVMFTRNDPEGRWVNGSVGAVTKMGKSSIRVAIQNGGTFDVEPVTWEDARYLYDEKEGHIEQEVLGTFTQFPLIPAWAVTIHKAQGLTLDQVAVDLDRGAFAPGQVYVALSRCVSLEGLSLRRPLRMHEVRSDPEAQAFCERIAMGERKTAER